MRVGSVRFCTIFWISTLRHVIQTSLGYFLVRFGHKALGRDQEKIMFSPEIPDSVSANKTGIKIEFRFSDLLLLLLWIRYGNRWSQNNHRDNRFFCKSMLARIQALVVEEWFPWMSALDCRQHISIYTFFTLVAQRTKSNTMKQKISSCFLVSFAVARLWTWKESKDLKKKNSRNLESHHLIPVDSCQPSLFYSSHISSSEGQRRELVVFTDWQIFPFLLQTWCRALWASIICSTKRRSA